jgi:hypothetical protein
VVIDDEDTKAGRTCGAPTLTVVLRPVTRHGQGAD